MSAEHGFWIRGLRAPATHHVEPVCSATTIHDFSERLGRPAVDWAVCTARDVTARITTSMPRFGKGPGEQITLRLGVESATLGIMASIEAGHVTDPRDTPEAVQSAQDFVHRGVPLPEIWASVRRSHRELNQELMRACTQVVPAQVQAAELQSLITLGFEFVDSLVDELGQAYAVEHERWVATTVAVREEIVRSLLDDEHVDPQTASAGLRYDVQHRHHVGIVVWQEPEADSDTSRLQQAALHWLDAFGTQQTLLIPQGRSELWAWGNRPTPFPAETPDAGPAVRDGVRLATGTAARDAHGFRQTHVDAQRAHRLALIAPGLTAPLITFTSVGLLSLLSSDESQARQFVLTELGDLAGDDAGTRDLRRTVRTYLELHSPQAAAARLFVVRNTVNYRIKRAEEMLGRPITERQLELGVALLLADALGI